MAPMFTSASPDSRVTSQKPFSLNMQNSRGSNFFSARPAASAMQTQQQEQQMDGSWDMGDDVSDGTHNDNDDSRALVFDNGDGDEQEETMQTFDSSYPGMFETYAEVDAFAMRLDSSTLLQSDDPNSNDTAVSGFELIGRLQEVSTGRLDSFREQVSEDLTDEERADLAYWQLEHQTWELFGTLTSHRIDAIMSTDAMPEELVQNKYTSNARFKAYLTQTDAKFKEWSLILQWLWINAPDPIDALDADFGDALGSGWIHTKAALKSQKMITGKKLSLQAGSNNFFAKKVDRNLITELDPDAPSRQQKRLAKEDEDAERRFMRLIWGYIRKGDITGAKYACSELGQWWRGASLGGGDDAWDQNIDGQLDTEEEEEMSGDRYAVVGNRRRELWRRMCFAIARKQGGDEWEKAVYGALCGDVDSVRDVCDSWEDHLYAHMNSLVEEYYSEYLATHGRIPSSVAKFPIFNSTAYHSKTGTLIDDETILERIIDSLSAADVLKSESRLPLRVIQGSLISFRFHELVAELDRQLQHFKDDPDYDPLLEEDSNGLDVTEHRTLRVVVHMLLVIQSLNAGFTAETPYHESAENVIAAYIEFLSECGKNELIPVYAGRLSPAKAVEVMGGILVKVKDDAQRQELLKLMKMHHIDIKGCLIRTMEISLEITQEVYERERKGVVRLAGLKGELREEDDMLVRGLDWLVSGGEELKVEVIKKGVIVYKRFLLAGRLSAAKVVYEKINSETIMASPEYTGHDSDVGASVRGYITEEEDFWFLAVYVDIEILVRALMALEDWNQTLKKRPERSDRLWKTSLAASYDSVHTKLADAVKNWLEAVITDAPPSCDTSFVKEVRNIYIPELTFALHDVYVEAGKCLNKTLLANCLELATVVADPGRNVLNTFLETGRIEEYVCAVAGASRSVLGAGTEKGGLGIWNVR